MMYGLTGNGSWLRFSRKAVPKEGIVMYWPADLAAKFYDGNTYGHPDEQGRMQWPGDVSEVRIWFKDEQ
jgi:hypothetical protein